MNTDQEKIASAAAWLDQNWSEDFFAAEYDAVLGLDEAMLREAYRRWRNAAVECAFASVRASDPCPFAPERCTQVPAVGTLLSVEGQDDTWQVVQHQYHFGPKLKRVTILVKKLSDDEQSQTRRL